MTRPINVAALASLDPEAFERIIELNATYDEPDSPQGQRRVELWGALATPELIDRTFGVLGRLLRRWEDTMATRKAKLDAFHRECLKKGAAGKRLFFTAKGDFDQWREHAVQARADVVRRRGDIDAIIQSHRTSGASPLTARGELTTPNPSKRKHNIDALFQLAHAVAQHREAYDRGGILPLPEDLELWELLDQLTMMTGDGPITLEKWVEDVTSRPDFQPRPGV